MYCAQNNRIYCIDCNKFYFPNNYSNHLKSKGHNINVMKKCCSSCNNHELSCNMNSLSLEPNDIIKNIIKSDQQKKKDDNSDILLLKLCNYHDCGSNTEAKAALEKIYKVKGILWGEYISCHDGYAYIRIKL